MIATIYRKSKEEKSILRRNLRAVDDSMLSTIVNGTNNIKKVVNVSER